MTSSDALAKSNVFKLKFCRLEDNPEAKSLPLGMWSG